jgi:two-component system, chemotaxis family, chemotaxis protein CheY
MVKKVLIVDDSPTVRHQVSVALSSVGYEIIEAADGSIGASEIAGRDDLALVICDVNMPNMDGLDMLDSVKARIAAIHLPVVMLTTEGNPESIARAKAAGAKGWIVKPFKVQALISVANKLTAA